MSGRDPSSGDLREARLAQALRANLRRRKAVEPPPEAAAPPPKTPSQDNRS